MFHHIDIRNVIIIFLGHIFVTKSPVTGIHHPGQDNYKWELLLSTSASIQAEREKVNSRDLLLSTSWLHMGQNFIENKGEQAFDPQVEVTLVGH